MLSGKLPFAGKTPQELLEAIRYSDPQDLRAIGPQISPELARIVRRCLAKRMSERFQSAAELAEDLEAFAKVNRKRRRTRASPRRQSRSSPRGCVALTPMIAIFSYARARSARSTRRSLGGPQLGTQTARHRPARDVSGRTAVRPERMRQVVSGAGGNPSTAAPNVKVLIVEGARDETELALIRELRRRFPELSAELSLPETLRELREGAWLVPGEKLLMVFDQFEQWLHGWRQDTPRNWSKRCGSATAGACRR